MNPGGIREDMVGNGTTYPRELTYRQAANVQSFANSLINMTLTGEQIKTVLEQQWQRNGSGAVPTRAFLRLGVSEGFTYTYKEIVDPSGSVPVGTKKGDVTGMWLNGEPIDPAETYSVTVNSFLSPGGDNFFEFANGTGKTDWGMTDLASMVAYFDEFGSGEDAIAPKYDQRAVAVNFPAGAPASYERGEHVVFDLEALAMTGSAAGVQDVTDATVQIWLDGAQIGTATVDNTVGSAANNNTTVNNAGKAHVDVTLPAGTALGANELTIVGTATGTEIVVPITVTEELPPSTIPTSTTATAPSMTYGTDGVVNVTVMPGTATGAVTVTAGGVTVGTGTVTSGTGTVTIDGEALDAGSHTLTVRYAGSATHDPSTGSVTMTVAQADTTVSADAPAVEFGEDAAVSVTVAPTSATGSVTVSEGGTELGAGALANGTVSVGVGELEPGSHTLTVRYAGDTNHEEATTSVTLVVTKVESTTSASTSPGQIRVVTGEATVSVTVSAGDVAPTGTVTVSVGGSTVSKPLTNGAASFSIGPFARPGMKSIQVRYSGDEHVSGSTDSTSVRVVKAHANMSADHSPNKVKVNQTNARLVVEVNAAGFTPGGTVSIRVPGQDNQSAELDNRGRAVFRLAEFSQTGEKAISISYGGDDRTESGGRPTRSGWSGGSRHRVTRAGLSLPG